jgi:hypothetical protein
MSGERYECGIGVVWSVEARGLRIMNTVSGGSQELPYPQAAIWDLVMRNTGRVIEKVAAIGGLAVDEAEELVRESVRQWVRDGFLVVRGE